jgi:hypothetical protein
MITFKSPNGNYVAYTHISTIGCHKKGMIYEIAPTRMGAISKLLTYLTNRNA